MARSIVIAGNWKLNLSVADGVALVGALDAQDTEVIVFPTMISLHPVAQAADGDADGVGIAVGAQNCYWEDSGAFTAETSAPLAAAAGASWILLGHSERRQYFGETDETVNKRLQAVLRAGLKPMVCIGETLAEREAGNLENVLRTQITGALAGLTAEALSDLVVAYEPVWAIGTGVVATDDQAQEAHAFVRSVLADVLGGPAADACRILYGGSVKPDNAEALLSKADIDGALVGGASLKPELFNPIIAAAGKVQAAV